MDDGSGVMLPYMTEIRHSIRENAMMGFELTEQLVAFGRQFHGQLQAALPSDIYAPEAIQLMNAWRELESKFLAFMDLVPFSDPLQLKAMLAQTEEFEAELRALPGLRTRVYPKKPPKADAETPVDRAAKTAEQGEEPAQPVFN